MQATVLSFFRLKEWLTNNNCIDVLPFIGGLVSTTTRYPSAFLAARPLGDLFGSSISKTEFIQVIVCDGRPNGDEIVELERLNIPFAMIIRGDKAPADAVADELPDIELYQNVAGQVAAPAAAQEEEEEAAPQLQAQPGQPVQNVRASLFRIMCVMLTDRQRLMNEWVELNDKHVNRGVEFLKECDSFFLEIASRLGTGNIVSVTQTWYANLERIVKNLETVSERFLRMEQAAPGVMASINTKRYRPMRKLDVTAPGLSSDSLILEDPSQPTLSNDSSSGNNNGGASLANGSTGTETDLDTKLSEMQDPLTKYILLALGMAGSKPHRGYRTLPVISPVYCSNERIQAHLAATFPPVMSAIRMTESQLSLHMLSRHGMEFRIGMILRNPYSTLFTTCAQLTGLYIRENELRSVTRNGFSAHARHEHQKTVNDTQESIHKLIRTSIDFRINWESA